MGNWNIQPDTSTHNIPATAGKYNSDSYYIGLLKNDEPNTTEAISDLTITKSVEWIKDAQIDPQTRSPNGDFYPLTYEVDENTDKSEREGYILITHNAANKTIKYIIKQAANTTQEPTEPTLNEYVFQITKYHSDKNYLLQVCGKSPDLNPDNKVSFASISTNDSTSLNINIKIALPATNDTSKPLKFNFMIIGDGFEFDSSIKYNGGTIDSKSVDIILGGEKKGTLDVGRNTTVSGGLNVHITISPNNLNPKALALLSEDIISEDTISKGVLSDSIEGTITIKNSTHNIKFKVTLGFGAL